MLPENRVAYQAASLHIPDFGKNHRIIADDQPERRRHHQADAQRAGREYVEYIDQTSGKTGDRDAFKRLFTDASRRLFDVVVVWALDRFTREGVLETFEYIRDLTRYGVQFESYTEAHFRTTGMAGELMLAITAWIAKQERLRITDRVNAGIARARLHGTKSGAAIGRPRAVFDRLQVVE
jgi:DNA invertase Pin-like site-specific DNA recombinase